MRFVLAFIFAISPFLAHAQHDRQKVLAATPAGTRPDKPLVLVAEPKLTSDLYGRAVVIAVRAGNGHFGFILNKLPGNLYKSPDYAPSKRVPGVMRYGGPVYENAVMAVIRPRENPGKAFQLMEGIFAVACDEDLDRVIEVYADRAVYFSGYMFWREGELKKELDQKLWRALDAPADIFDEPIPGMWERFNERANAQKERRLMK